MAAEARSGLITEIDYYFGEEKIRVEIKYDNVSIELPDFSDYEITHDELEISF